jgi:predicted O-methyltransferase YrrM
LPAPDDSIPRAIATGEIRWHVQFIAELARVLRPNVYVELGIHTAELFNLAAPFAGHAIGVDIDPAAGGHIVSARNARFFCGRTDDFIRAAEQNDLMIDMLFIDADHSRAAVLRDFADYFPHVRPQGLILLHDSDPDPELISPDWCGDGYLAVEELARTAQAYEMVTIPLSPGLTICRKRTRQLSSQEPSEDGMAPAAWGARNDKRDPARVEAPGSVAAFTARLRRLLARVRS